MKSEQVAVGPYGSKIFRVQDMTWLPVVSKSSPVSKALSAEEEADEAQ